MTMNVNNAFAKGGSRPYEGAQMGVFLYDEMLAFANGANGCCDWEDYDRGDYTYPDIGCYLAEHEQVDCCSWKILGSVQTARYNYRVGRFTDYTNHAHNNTDEFFSMLPNLWHEKDNFGFETMSRKAVAEALRKPGDKQSPDHPIVATMRVIAHRSGITDEQFADALDPPPKQKGKKRIPHEMVQP